jgi:hypothetical protein
MFQPVIKPWYTKIRSTSLQNKGTCLRIEERSVDWVQIHLSFIEKPQVRFPMGSLGFLFELILPAALWPWILLSVWQKWVPGLSPGGKGDRSTLAAFICRLFRNCDCLNLLEPSGLVQACNGIPLLCCTVTRNGTAHSKTMLQQLNCCNTHTLRQGELSLVYCNSRIQSSRSKGSKLISSTNTVCSSQFTPCLSQIRFNRRAYKDLL